MSKLASKIKHAFRVATKRQLPSSDLKMLSTVGGYNREGSLILEWLTGNKKTTTLSRDDERITKVWGTYVCTSTPDASERYKRMHTGWYLVDRVEGTYDLNGRLVEMEARSYEPRRM